MTPSLPFLKNKKRNVISILLAGVITSCLLSLFLNFDQHFIYPVKDVKQYEIGTYHEEMDSNFTIANFTIKNGIIQFNYELSNKRDEPFAAFYFRHANIDSNLLDLSNFNHLRIHLNSKKAQRIPINLRFRNDSIIKLSKTFPEILLSKVIEYEKPGYYTIPLNSFELAAWWLRFHGIEKEDIDPKKTRKLMYLAIGSCQALEPGGKDTIEIASLEFYNSNHLIYWGYLLTWILVIIGLYLIFRKKEAKIIAPIVVDHLDINPDDSEQKQKATLIKNYIGQHFQDPDLSMYHFEKECKVSANEIRKIFKEEIQESFKNYLKTVRLIEVKKLLLDSDFSISEIAYKCGYNDIPHFNRLFKQEFGITPKEFRNQ